MSFPSVNSTDVQEKLFFNFFFFYIFPYVEINLHWFSSQLNTVYFLLVHFLKFNFIICMIIIYIIYFTFHLSDFEFA